ncbi:RagB/SusD family nutrient uptake outer membrane protein [Robiginitalea sp. M366]|uniref:RagB/SusD family nutrient uptake outer membrane protein n=1 Tax=Robiginitalea aestuariiviva TaxID=3036903 RepID=UPI00240E2E22|nr:RagB/SusD family nutrient uptake outer membrane protein [Robiginitalea aestuariiviva]MDG1571819.1 RagB/SusD family nutrient uptake outer membrane protein [Robiginitalea aestuariiviva]
MKKYLILAAVVALAGFLNGCHKELDQTPIDPDLFTEVDVYQSADEAKSALAKVYASLSLTGQNGPAGQPDISGIDEGFSQFSRMLFNLNELTTDHCVVGWGDPGLPNLHEMSWGSGNDFTTAMYFRLSQVVSFSNSFISNAENLASDAEVQHYIAEARFLRAYAYYNLMDLFGSVPLVTAITTELPQQSSRSEIFGFVEAELLEIQDALKSPGSNEYGRVDQVAAWALLSRLYLNAEVFNGEARYTNSVTYAEMAINSTYSINTADGNGNGSAYDELFLADNDRNGSQNEFIFVLTYDGLKSQTYGGTTFLTHGPVGGNMDPADFGINGGWSGYRTTKGLVQKFDYAINASDGDGFPVGWDDSRAQFFTDGQNYEITTIANTFEDGYALSKFRNVDVTGAPGSDTSGDFADIDLPIIRLAEVYLNYAEASLRGGGGSAATSAALINELRTRASAPTITTADLDLQFVLDERSRELHWEGLRRTDLIRYGLFTGGSYLWPFKGGASNGRAVEDFRKIFPLPDNVLLINTNLTQNPGY